MRSRAASSLTAIEEPERLLITVKKARELLSLGHGKIYELLADGSLESVKIGRRRLITYASAQRLAAPARE